MRSKILLVDDHVILIDGLTSLLQSKPDVEVAAVTSSANFALAYLTKEPFDLLITDYSMPDMDGLTLVQRAKALRPLLKIIVLTMHDETPIIRSVMAAGVDAYVLKKYARQELFHAIDAVVSGRQYWSQEVTKALLHAHNIDTGNIAVDLTDRELEVLRLIVQEQTSKQIADQLFISDRTVETHRKNLLRKTGSNNTIGLIKYAYQHKLL
ncbi:response regulator [Parapedobacter sp. 2B3]|uniref:response regulator n=1 Tax=Parapedobacter sp. 2B3 TaxID=3342381 RepID=UPI0035B5C902